MTNILWPVNGYNRGPISQVQPFVYPDAVSNLDILYHLKGYLTDQLIPGLNGIKEEVDNALDIQDEANDAKIAELTESVNEAVLEVINSSIEVQDPVVAGLINDVSSLSFQASAGAFPVYRVWDGTTYPPRVPGAVNIFFGPVNPDLAAAPDDYWADPDVTTLADVTAKALDSSSDLFQAMTTGMSADIQPVEIMSLTPLFGGSVPGIDAIGWALPADVATPIFIRGKAPYGWTTARVKLYFASATSGDARFSRRGITYRDGDNTPTAVASQAHTASITGGRVASSTLSGDIDLTNRNGVSMRVTREGQAASDTIDGSIIILNAFLVKTS